MIVDDCPKVRESFKKFLNKLVHLEIIAEAEMIVESLELIRSETPQVLLLDFKLKDGNALELLKQLSLSERPPTIIIVTLHIVPLAKEACLAAGADYFFNKSTDLKELQTLLVKLSETEYRPPSA